MFLKMRLPCENYIRYLLVGGRDRLSLQEIKRQILILGYSEPGTDYLIALRSDLEESRPKPFMLEDPKVRQWLMDNGFWELTYPTSEVRTAFSILGTPEQRLLLEALLLCGIPDEEIPASFHEKTGVELTSEVVETYEYYFWNRAFFSQRGWREFLKYYVDDGPLLTKCLTGDPEYTLVLFRIRADIGTSVMLGSMARAAFLRYQETIGMTMSTDVSRIMKNMADIALSVAQQMGSTDKLGQAVEELRQISVANRDPKAPPPIPEKNILDGSGG